MFIGHYGVALAAKHRSSALSLGVLFVAVQALDVLFSLFVLGGAEHLRIVPGFTAYNPYDLYDMPLSHSLVAAVGWSVLTAAVALAFRLDRTAAVVLGLAVFSHFVLDFPVHTPDLPLAGEHSTKLGLGLWNHRAATLALEIVTVGAGLFLYARSRRASLRPRFWVFAIVLLVLALATPFLPPPGSPTIFALQALSSYVGLAAWAWWVER
jgi:hypothetical protein